MKFVAAYLLACMGAESIAAAEAEAAAAAAAEGAEEGAAPVPVAAPARPTKDDVRRILDSVGAEVDEDRLDLLFAKLDGRDVAELVAAGREQLAYEPSGAAAVVAAALPAAAIEGKEEEEEEEEEEEDTAMFSLFDD